MSTAGIASARAHDDAFRQRFPRVAPAYITDDYDPPAAERTALGFPLFSMKFWSIGCCPGVHGVDQPHYKLLPNIDVVPRATWWHERGHHLVRLILDRVGGIYDIGLYEDALRIRGVVPDVTTRIPGSNNLQANEQFCSMLPEAFFGEWGGYTMVDPAVDPVKYPASPTAAAMRAFYLSYDRWEPSAELVERMKPVITMPPSPTPGGSMKVIDLRSQLPLATQFIPSPSHALKTSNTVHWTGGHDTIVTDEQAIAAIKRWHQQHINTDWNTEAPGYQGGAGLMYLEVIAPSGTVFLTRDPDAVTWHCSDLHGNAHSRPILVICDQDEPPTNQQLASLDSRITFDEFRPHGLPGGWVATQCPGPQLRAFIDERRVDDMFTAQDRAKLDRVYQHQEAYEPLVWIGRLQRWLAKAIRSVFPNADLTGPDVETNQPFKP